MPKKVIRSFEVTHSPLEQLAATACVVATSLALVAADPSDASLSIYLTPQEPLVRIIVNDLSVTSLPQEAQFVETTDDSTDTASQLLERVIGLHDGWDGEGAIAPSPSAVDLARQVIICAADVGLVPGEVDPDVLGGVSIWFSSAMNDDDDHRRYVWVSCMNDGAQTVIYGGDGSGTVRALKFKVDELLNVKRFLHGENVT